MRVRCGDQKRCSKHTLSTTCIQPGIAREVGSVIQIAGRRNIRKISIFSDLYASLQVEIARVVMGDDDDPKKQPENGGEKDKLYTNFHETIFNIINANVGTGVLCMPYVIHVGGGWGVLFILLFAFMGNYTGQNLIELMYETNAEGVRVRVRSSYADVGEAFHGGSGRLMVQVVNCMEQFAHCTLLLIMPGAIASETFPHSGLSESRWTVLFSIVVIPTIFIRRMKQVTWTSIISVCIAVVISTIVIGYSQFFTSREMQFRSLPKMDLHTFPIAFGMMVVTYASQPYLPNIEHCMEKPEHFKHLANLSYTIVFLFKLSVGLAGFSIFGNETEQLLNLNLPHNAVGVTVNIAAIILALSFFTVPMCTVFDIIENQMFLHSNVHKVLISDDYYLGCHWLTVNLLVRFSLVSMFIGVASSVPHFSVFMSLIGNTSGMCLVFIYPTMFFAKLKYGQVSRYETMLNIAMCIIAIGASIFGAVTSVLALKAAYTKCDWSVKCHKHAY